MPVAITRMVEADPNLVAGERRIAGLERRWREVKQRYSTAA